MAPPPLSITLTVMKDVFITGTWRKEWNKDFNLKLEEALATEGFSCFLPQRDSNQTGTKEEIFLDDIAGINNAKLLLAVGANNAQSSNWGMEIGYAYASQKPVVILTDRDSPPDLMTTGAANEVMTPGDISDIQSYIKNLSALIQQLISSKK